MFVDEAIVTFRAGKGGDGTVSWRREKYIPNGGPYGGDGGSGGNIILRVNENINTLSDFRHKKAIRAEDGERGGTKVMAGRSGTDHIIEVPLGTIVSDPETNECVIDLDTLGQEFVLCRGGRGGFGNAHFSSSTRQAPHFAELGDVGEEKIVRLELKLVADVGIIGFPNAGKSTLIQSVTNVRPKIADYPFTTLVPNLGVMEYKERALVLEDVPGLIPGASTGKGLGIQFLKHIDRTRILVHLIDGSLEESAIIESYTLIRKELQSWSEELAEKPEIVVLSKMDLVDEADWESKKRAIAKKIFPGKKKGEIFAISAGAYIGLDALKDAIIRSIPTKIEPPETPQEYVRVYDLKKNTEDPHDYTLTQTDANTFLVTGKRIEEIVRMTDMRYPDAVGRVYDIMEKVGITRKVEKTISQEVLNDGSGFYEGMPDREIPVVMIAGKKFPLEGVIFFGKK